MSVPNFDFNRPDLHVGDTRDDDAQVLDDLIESEAEPPTPEEMPTEKGEPLINPVKITRLITGSMNVSKDWSVPTQILPADPNRRSLEINVNSITATDVVLFADEQNKAQSPVTALSVSPATRSFSLGGHTGALWVFAPGVAASALVTWAAVTE